MIATEFLMIATEFLNRCSSRYVLAKAPNMLMTTNSTHLHHCHQCCSRVAAAEVGRMAGSGSLAADDLGIV